MSWIIRVLLHLRMKNAIAIQHGNRQSRSKNALDFLLMPQFTVTSARIPISDPRSSLGQRNRKIRVEVKARNLACPSLRRKERFSKSLDIYNFRKWRSLILFRKILNNNGDKGSLRKRCGYCKRFSTLNTTVGGRFTPQYYTTRPLFCSCFHLFSEFG